VTGAQSDLFDLFAPAPPAQPDCPPTVDDQPRPEAITPVMKVRSSVHWILITTTKARTACGIPMPAYYDKLKCGYSDKGQRLSCTHNRDDGTVTCEGCLEEMR
jgi:hypothetical protein